MLILYIRKEIKMKKPKGWTPDTYYILGDKHPKMSLGTACMIKFAHFPTKGKHIKAVWSKEYRAPDAGEWYLSGCEGFVRAYQAKQDLCTEYFIANIVEVETKTWTTTKVVRALEN